MRTVTFDCETTIFESGNPFARRNRLCYVGIDVDGTYSDYDIEYSNSPYGHHMASIKKSLESAELLIGFNVKFDLHWIRRYVRDIAFPWRVWDCQLAEFLLSNQQWVYPSLAESLVRRGLDPKLDVVSSEYWAHGVDTPMVPEELLCDYLRTDVTQTKALYLAQREEFEKRDPNLLRLFSLQCMDLLVLQEMEFNGMLYNVEESNRLATETKTILEKLDNSLVEITGLDEVNFNSSDVISRILFGGDIPVKCRVPTERVLKDGTVKHGEKWGIKYIKRERLCEPRRGTETATEGIWSVSEDSLKGLKARGDAKRIVSTLLERGKLQKLVSTYYVGVPDIIATKDWEDGVVHGQFNQAVAATGRLTSSAPNLQNFAGDIKGLFKSRYQ